jgi:hypothetical protein
MPTAVTPPVVTNTARPGPRILTAIIARLCALNSTDPTIVALLAEYQTATGQPLS